MWIRTSKHKALSLDSGRLDSIQVRPIMHSDSFGIFLKGREENIINCGDLEQAEAIMNRLCDSLKEGQAFLDLSEELD